MFDFMIMGNYTVYVWSAVGIVVASFVMVTWRAQTQFKRAQKTVLWSKHVQS